MRLFSIVCLCMIFLVGLSACQKGSNNVENKKTAPEFTVLDAASNGRDQQAESVVSVQDVAKSIEITATTNYPLWRESLSASIDIAFVTISKQFVSARVLPKVFIYPEGSTEPEYWSVINLSTSFALEPGVKTLLVLPVGAQKTISSPINRLQWARMDMPWPYLNYYQIVPTGDYSFQLVLEIYDEEDKLVDSVKTPLQKYTSIFTAPEVVPPPVH